MTRGTRLARIVLVIFLAASPAFTAEYRGSVGKLDAVFDLEFRENGRVRGTYHYPSRPGVVYRLSGKNPEEGYIVLKEFTGETQSAVCELRKTISENRVVWRGRMYNTDGREFPMSFSRRRDSAMPALPPEASEFPEPEIDRTLHAENVAAVLGKPGQLEAQLYGKLYYGWVRPGPLPRVNSLRGLADRFKEDGGPVWAAMRFSGPDVELQFEDTGGRRQVLTGTNPEEGRLELRDETGTRWIAVKRLEGDAIAWIAQSAADPARSLLVYRPRDEIYHRGYEEMGNLAPEAFLWQFNEWGSDYHEARFPFYEREPEKATVTRVEQSGGSVRSVVFRLADGNEATLLLDPARPRNRVPVAEGYPVDLWREDGEIIHLMVGLTPMAWRKRDDHVLELRLFPTELAGITWNDVGDPVLPPGRVESLTKIDLVPDFAIIADDIYANWFLEEDVVTWGIGDRGAGMLELESLSLEESPAPAGIGPWHPVSEPIDFVTNQLRIVNMSTPGGFGWVLPGNEPP